jgi:diguanylate cyclase (GGDEF)-like protein
LEPLELCGLRFEPRGEDWYVGERLVRHGSELRVGDTVLEVVEYIVETHYQISATDGLTKLFNKRTLLERITIDMRARPLAVVRIDVDSLRAINHERGHEAGDQVLVAISNLVRAQLRAEDYAGRLSADDLLVVMPDADLPTARLRADELRAQAAIPISTGVAVLDTRDRDADELVYRAEADMARQGSV